MPGEARRFAAAVLREARAQTLALAQTYGAALDPRGYVMASLSVERALAEEFRRVAHRWRVPALRKTEWLVVLRDGAERGTICARIPAGLWI